jgi:hypothetical protein
MFSLGNRIKEETNHATLGEVLHSTGLDTLVYCSFGKLLHIILFAPILREQKNSRRSQPARHLQIFR